jgi:3alpha(or 20beta)-hydroxysteroid dehydrogenase
LTLLDDLSGKTVLIAGGAGGLGEAQARLFHSIGARVVVADTNEHRCGEIAQELGDRSRPLVLDVRSAQSWRDGVTDVVEAFGGLDVLVNSFGVAPQSDMQDLALTEYEHVIGVNQTGVFLGMQAVAPIMRAAGGGSIVNLSSAGGISPRPRLFAYSASKAAVIAMTKTAAIELGHDNIRVNCVCPGGFDTNLRASTAQQWANAGLGNTAGASFQHLPIPRLGRSAEMANVVVFLASDASSYCTGAVFLVDGGALAGRP